MKGVPSSLRCYGLVAVACWSTAHGWAYDEHVKITYRAFAEACRDLGSSHSNNTARENDSAILSHLCRPEFQVCFAHLVAIAGDYARDEEALIGAFQRRQKGLLKRDDGLDCRAMLESPSSLESNSDRRFSAGLIALADVQSSRSSTNWITRSLAPASILSRLAYANLALTNPEHFLPDAEHAWKRRLAELLDAPGGYPTASWLVEAAFAFHFLEDSFPAGHIGLDRHDSQQDYANAYHDDFNRVGRFVRVGAEEWYTYGDGYLDRRPSFYLELDQVVAWPASNSWRAAVEQLRSLDVFADSDFRRIVAADIIDLGTTKEQLHVLSLPKKKDGFWNLCFFWDDCEKTEIVVLHGGFAPSLHGRCKKIAVTPPLLNLWQCDEETALPTTNAVTLAVRSLLLHLTDRNFEARANASDIATLVPTAYRTLIDDNKIGSRTINKSAFAMRFGELRNLRDLPQQPTTEWGFSVETRTGTPGWLNKSALAWSIRLSDTVKSFKALVSHRGDSHDVVGTDQQGSQGQRSAPWRLALLNRYEIIDERGKILDSFEIGGYSDYLRVYHGAFGLSPKLTLGIDSIWDGTRKRNYYGGAGVSFDMHVGKQILFLDFDRQWHRGSSIHSAPSLRITIGYRVMSVDLDRKRGVD